jgi:hypothetical protein
MRILIPAIMLALWAIDGNANEWFKRYLVSADTTKSIISCGTAEANPNDPQGGYLVLGFDYLLRIDASGRTLWEKSYPLLPSKIKSAQYTEDNGFILGANKGVTKIDKNGNPAWGADANGTPLLRNSTGAIRIHKFGDKSYICISGGEVTGTGAIIIIRENDSATAPESLSLPKGYSALPTMDGGAISCGDGAAGVIVSKIKSDRKPDSSFGLNGTATIPMFSNAYSFDCTSDSGYVIACQEEEGASEDIVLIKIDKKGAVVSLNWNGRFNNLHVSAYIPQMRIRWGVKALKSGGYLLAGTCKGTKDESDYFILKADASGNEMWSKRFDHTGRDGFS